MRKEALTAIVLGAAAYATGACLDNETTRGMMEYVLNEDYVNVMAQYAGLSQLCGAAAMAAGTLGAVVNALSPAKKKKKSKSDPGASF